MTVIDDIKWAVFNYPNDDVDVTITNFGVVAPPGGNLNVNDIFRFKVRISNTGCLDMINVKAKVFGSEWADVSLLQAGPYSAGPIMSTTAFSISAFASYETGWFYGRAKKRSDPDTKTIVTASLGDWDASLGHILNSASMQGPEEGKLDEIIYPS